MKRREFRPRPKASSTPAVIDLQVAPDCPAQLLQLLQEGPKSGLSLGSGAAALGAMRKYAAELVALSPDVLLGPGTTPVGPPKPVGHQQTLPLW
jgi:hypothetical protein